MSRLVLPVLLFISIGIGAGALSACASPDEPSAEPPVTTRPHTTTQTAPPTTAAPEPFDTPQEQYPPYQPPAEELYINGKRLAGRVAQELATFGPSATIAELTNGVTPATGGTTELQRVVAPLHDPARRAAADVAYVELSGVTATTLGTMVIVRQHLEDAEGRRELVVRVMDVRLRRTDGPWSLDRVASVGGRPVPRPATVSAAAARVLDHPSIDLPDTARWDIYRGDVDDGLLSALADAADRWPLAISVFRSGHPDKVWATRRTSAHTAGLAADIYAVDGQLVVRQGSNESSARKLVAVFLAGGATQVGSPWSLPPGGRRSFTDRVHRDHNHVQQRGAVRPGAG